MIPPDGAGFPLRYNIDYLRDEILRLFRLSSRQVRSERPFDPSILPRAGSAQGEGD